MNPWLLFVGPIVAAVAPWTIPVMVGIAIWQLTRGGEAPGAAVAAWSRARNAEAFTAHARATTPGAPPQEIPEEESAGLYESCLSCGEGLVYRHGAGWRHIVPNDNCWEPPVPARKEAADGDH